MKNKLTNLALYLKKKRKLTGLSQKELSEKSGVGLRFIRDLEQGKTTLRMDKVNQVLKMFGDELTPAPIDREKLLNPWEKKKIKQTDFTAALKLSKIEDKVIENLFLKYEKMTPKWLSFIDISFVPDNMKTAYTELIKQKAKQIKSTAEEYKKTQ